MQFSTINKENLETFEGAADSWWQQDGPFRLLHRMNPVRLSYIKSLILSHFDAATLFNLNILDIGCGGGVLCEPLARLGANVTGLDASPHAIEVALGHAQNQNLKINYINGSIENFKSKKKFNVITMLEVLEHVDNLDFFIQNAAQHLAPNGLLFFSTLNRNYWSYLGAIFMAEYITQWVPRNTHNWNKFIKPSELSKNLLNHGLSIISLKGLKLKPISQRWELTKSPTINYIGCARFV